MQCVRSTVPLPTISNGSKYDEQTKRIITEQQCNLLPVVVVGYNLTTALYTPPETCSWDGEQSIPGPTSRHQHMRAWWLNDWLNPGIRAQACYYILLLCQFAPLYGMSPNLFWFRWTCHVMERGSCCEIKKSSDKPWKLFRVILWASTIFTIFLSLWIAAIVVRTTGGFNPKRKKDEGVLRACHNAAKLRRSATQS